MNFKERKRMKKLILIIGLLFLTISFINSADLIMRAISEKGTEILLYSDNSWVEKEPKIINLDWELPSEEKLFTYTQNVIDKLVFKNYIDNYLGVNKNHSIAVITKAFISYQARVAYSREEQIDLILTALSYIELDNLKVITEYGLNGYDSEKYLYLTLAELYADSEQYVNAITIYQKIIDDYINDEENFSYISDLEGYISLSGNSIFDVSKDWIETQIYTLKLKMNN